jgi:hypothetical protein
VTERDTVKILALRIRQLGLLSNLKKFHFSSPANVSKIEDEIFLLELSLLDPTVRSNGYKICKPSYLGTFIRTYF